jgi:hypothetical protein
MELYIVVKKFKEFDLLDWHSYYCKTFVVVVVVVVVLDNNFVGTDIEMYLFVVAVGQEFV